jgi:predicted ATP-grasp superfamily ATP-dependent carboligase
MNDSPDAAVVLCVGMNALGVIRALWRRRIHVTAIYFDARSPVRYSVAANVKIRLDAGDEDALWRVLTRLAGDRAVIFATSDAHADFLSRHRDRLLQMGLRPAVTSGRVTELLNDKARELELMTSMSVTIPKSLVQLPAGADEFLALLSLPVIVKPRSYVHAHRLVDKNLILESREDVRAFLARHHDALEAFVAQEVIGGPDDALWVCNCCFDNEARLVTAFTFQRLRMMPAHFGATSFAVGRQNAAVKQQCADLGAALQYTGPAMFEFKYDAPRDAYCYLETNPRFGMCNALDAMSGVDNVYAAYQVARGEHSEAHPERQQDGVVFLCVYGDFYSRFTDGEPLSQILRSYWSTRHARHAWAYFDARDPLPFVQSARESVRKLTGSVTRKLVRALRRR